MAQGLTPREPGWAEQAWEGTSPSLFAVGPRLPEPNSLDEPLLPG